MSLNSMKTSKYKQSCSRCRNLDPLMKMHRLRPAAKTGNIPTRLKADAQKMIGGIMSEGRRLRKHMEDDKEIFEF